MAEDFAARLSGIKKIKIQVFGIQALLAEQRLPGRFVDRMAIGDYAVEIKDNSLQHTNRREKFAARTNASLSARAHHALADRGENGVGSTEMRVFDMLHII